MSASCALSRSSARAIADRVLRVEQEVRPDLRVERLQPGACELAFHASEVQLTLAAGAVVDHGLLRAAMAA